MDLGVFVLFVLGMALSLYAVGLLYQDIEKLKLITLSVSGYFAVFVIVSGFFFWVDRFAMTSVLLTEAAVYAVAVIVLLIRRKKVTFTSKWEARGPLIILVILLGFLVSFVKFDFFGMGQDQGVYQTKAIALANGTTDNQYYFPGLESMPDRSMRREAINDIKQLPGYYFYKVEKPTMSQEKKLGDTAAIFHGIPTFPAIMALAVQMFGLSNMQLFNSVFYLCAASFVLLITEKMGLKKSARLLAVSVVALSPVVQWVMKSALTEGFLTLLYAGILYGMLDRHPYSKYWSALFIWGFAFFHVTIYVMLPLFAVLFILLYQETKDRRYLLANCIAAIGFAVGITMMCYVSPGYTYNNICNGFSFFKTIGDDKVLPFIWVAAAVLIGLSAFLARVDMQKVYGLLKKERPFTWLIRLVMLAVLALVIMRGVVIYRGDAVKGHFMRGGDWREVQRLTLLMFGYATGVFAFVATLVRLFLRPKMMLENRENLVIGAAFFYCVLLMSALIRREIYYIYYYTRYLAPYIIVCALAFGAFLNALSKRVLTMLMVGGAVVLLPFDWTLATQKDESRMEWDIMEDLLRLDSENGAVVVDGDEHLVQLTTLLPLEIATDLDAYPLLEDFEDELKLLEKRYDEIYIVTNRPNEFTSRSDMNPFSVLYRNKYICSDDDRTVVGTVIPFPYDMKKVEMTIAVLEYGAPRTEYDFAADETDMYGIGDLEEDCFRWLNEPEAGFTATLEKDEYDMIVTTGPQPPLGTLGLDSYSVDVYVNDHMIGSITEKTGEAETVYTLHVPEKVLAEGENDIRFEGDTWSPEDFGADDDRTMTISLQKVLFFRPDHMSELDFGDGDEGFGFTGFADNEGSFRWMNQQTATVTDTELTPESDYNVYVALGSEIPKAVAGRDGNYNVSFTVNGEADSETVVPVKPGDTELFFTIDRQYLQEGANKLFITCEELWSPADHGGDDTRQLGLCIDKITFKRTDW